MPDLGTLYDEIRKIALWLRSNQHAALGVELQNCLSHGGASGMEVTGNIRIVLRKILAHPNFGDQKHETVREIQRCIVYIDYIWGDQTHEGNPYG